MDYLNSANGTISNPAYPGAQLPLQQGLAFLHRYGAILEVLVLIPLYWPLWLQTFKFLQGFPISKRGAKIGYPPKTLPLHILAGFIITVRYYAKNCFTTPTTESLDFVLGILQLSSASYLSKWGPNKSTPSKAFFQTMTLVFVVPLIMAYTTASPQWHRTYVKCIEWFLTFRWVGHAIKKYKVFCYPEIPIEASVHMVSIPITLWLADWMGGVPLYLAVAPSIMLLEQWVTRQVPHRYVGEALSAVDSPMSL